MIYKLSELFDLQMGKTPSRNNASYWNSKENKWISIGDLSKCDIYISDTKEYISNLAVLESGIKLIPKNTVIMSFKLSIGKAAITAEDMYSNEAIMAFLDKNIAPILPEYLCYMFNYMNWEVGTNKAVLGKTLNKTTLSEIKIKIHGLNEQKIIIKKLNKLKQTISARNKQLKLYDKLVKSLFVEMFGDFVENPKCYKKEPIETHVDLLSGYPFKSSQYVDVGINICGGLIIMPQTIKWEDCLHWESADGYEEYMLQENDIVMALDRPWISDGFKIAKVDAEYLPALLIQRTARIRAIDINQEYLYYCFIIGGFERHSSITGSLVPHISLKDIRSFQILIPPLKLQEQFADIVGKIDKHKSVVQKSLDETQLLFDSLMQKYFG